MKKVLILIALAVCLCSCVAKKDTCAFEMRGVVLTTKELAEVDWVSLAASNGLNTIGTHITPSEVVAFLSTPEGRRFRKDCKRNGIAVEHQLHAMGELLPRDLFEEAPSMFRMDSTGQRTTDYNCCAHSEKALEIIAENAAKLAKVLHPDNHRYYFWLDDNVPTCYCERCREYSPSEQALLIENRMLKEIRKVDPKAKLAHLAYSMFMEPPVKVKPEEGIFLEFAPIYRSWEVPLTETEALCPRGYPVTNGDNLRWLEENLKVFPADDAVVLEYWLDVSLFSRWKRPAVQLPWKGDVCSSDLATYASYGIKNVTSFAVYMDAGYFECFPSTLPIEEYGQMLCNFKIFNGLTDWWSNVIDSTFVTISKDTGRLHVSFDVNDGTPVFNDSTDERSVDFSDRVEVFLSCDPDLNCYYGFEIDPQGKVMDYRCSYYRRFDYGWQSGISASGKPHDGGYRVDVDFPMSFLEELGVLQEDNRIILGLYRADAVTPDDIRWYSLINPQTPEPDFHVPASFFRF